MNFTSLQNRGPQHGASNGVEHNKNGVGQDQNGVGQKRNGVEQNQNGLGQNVAILNSWKEISAYIGRGVRTVQRWEQEFGLPVRRPGGHIRGSVIAIRGEIDAWLVSRAARSIPEAAPNHSATPRRSVIAVQADHHAHAEQLRSNLDAMKKRYDALLAANQRLQENMERSQALADAVRREIRQPRQQQLPAFLSSVPTRAD